MTISLNCDCGKRLRVGRELAGKRVKCPGCGKILTARAPTAGKADTTPTVTAGPGSTQAPAAADPNLSGLQPVAAMTEPDGDSPAQRGRLMFRRAAMVLAGSAAGIGLLWLCVCGLAVAQTVAKRLDLGSTLIAGALSVFWLGVGGLAALRQRWAIYVLLVFAYLNLLMHLLPLYFFYTEARTTDDIRIAAAGSYLGIAVLLVLLWQAHRANDLARATRRAELGQHPIHLQPWSAIFNGWAAGVLLLVLAIGASLSGWIKGQPTGNTTTIATYGQGGAASEVIESENFRSESTRVNGRWVEKVIYDRVVLLGVPLPRWTLRIVGIFLLLAAAAVFVKPWRFFRRPGKAIEPLSCT